MSRLFACISLAVVASLLAAPATAQRIKLPVGLKELEKAVVKDSADAAAHYNLALGYWNEKRYDEAEAELQRATAIDARFAEAYLALAYLPYAKRPKLWDEESERRVPDEWKSALEQSDRLYRRAFLVNPMVDMRIMGAVTPAKDPRWDTYYARLYDLVFRGFDDFAEGKYEQAYGRFVTYVREFHRGKTDSDLPTSVLWFQGLAAAHTQRYDVAADDFTLLIKQERDYQEKHKEEILRVPLRTNEYRYFLAVIRHRAGDVTEAIRLYQEALENDLGLYMAHVQLADIYESRRQYPEAIEERQRAIAANPDDSSLLLDLGITLGKAGRFADAETPLMQAMSASPLDPRAPFWLGLARVQLNKKAEARAAYQRFLELAPSRFERQIAMAREQLARLN